MAGIPSPSKQQKPSISATRVIASTLGATVGLAGMEHGFFELLQGNATTSGLVIDAIGPAQKLWVGATEPALTVIPNFFVSGILAMSVGFSVTIWAVAFVQRKYGALHSANSFHRAFSGWRRLSTDIPRSRS